MPSRLPDDGAKRERSIMHDDSVRPACYLRVAPAHNE